MRRLLGALSDLTITLAALLALFLTWQLWWTDVEGVANQQEVVQSLGWAAEPETQPVLDTLVQHRDPAPSIEAPAHGVTFATLTVPRWGPDYVRPISQGVSKRDILDVLGIGHYEDGVMPGQLGNFTLAGHRTTYGKPFNRVAELQIGDPLVVQTEETWYVYRVTGTEIVQPSEVEVIAPVPNQPGATPDKAYMTLTTCHPMYSAKERFIVYSELDYWAPVSDGVPPELKGS